jgi:hypothetical protein
MNWFKYNTLYVNGSSLTAGGGLGNGDIKEEYKRVYNLEWDNEKDVTYPKYVADHFNIKLIHKALSGSGAPRLVREVYEYIINVGLEEAKNTLFLLEITDPIHRVDLYCNEIDDYIIANVRYDDDYTGDSKISSIQIQHITTRDGRYFDYKYFEGRIENEIKNYLEKYHNPIAYTEKYYGDVAGLLSFLKENDLTFFYMFNEHTLKTPLPEFYKKFKDYEIRIQGHNCINQFSGINKLTIRDELNNFSTDLHPGYFGNKKYGEMLIDELVRRLQPSLFVYGDSHTQPFKDLCNSGMDWALKYVNHINETPKNYADLISEEYGGLKITNAGRGGFSNYSIFEEFLKNKHRITERDILVFGWTTESRFRIANESNTLIDIIPFNQHPKQNDDVSKTTTDEIAVNKISYDVWWTEISNYIEIINSLFPKNLIYHWTWIDNETTYPTRLWSEEMLTKDYIIIVTDYWELYPKEYQKIIEDNADVLFDLNKSNNYPNIADDVKSGKKVVLKNFINSKNQIDFLTKNKFKSRFLSPKNYKKECFDNFIPYKKYTTISQETNNVVDDLHTSKIGHQELATDLIALIENDLKNSTKITYDKKRLL